MASGESRSIAHGGPNQVELDRFGVDYRDVIDFSVSTNPYGPAPEMRDAIAAASIATYPEPSAALARRALGEWLDVSEAGVVVGNGAADLLWATARAFLAPGDPVLIVEPTFSELRNACLALHANVIEWRARTEDNFAIDLDALSRLIRQHSVRLVYLCSPNTPTGTSLSIDVLSPWAQQHPDTLLVLDQSFLSLSEDAADRGTPVPGHVLCVRSLTKDHAVPGVRAGYLVTTPRRAARIEAQRPAWSASAMAQAVAITAPTLDDFVAESRARLLDDRRALADDLAALGLQTFPSRTSFLLARVPDALVVRTALLLQHRILVRSCASFGLPDMVRFGARPAADRARLIEALRSTL